MIELHDLQQMYILDYYRIFRSKDCPLMRWLIVYGMAMTLLANLCLYKFTFFSSIENNLLPCSELPTVQYHRTVLIIRLPWPRLVFVVLFRPILWLVQILLATIPTRMILIATQVCANRSFCLRSGISVSICFPE